MATKKATTRNAALGHTQKPPQICASWHKSVLGRALYLQRHSRALNCGARRPSLSGSWPAALKLDARFRPVLPLGRASNWPLQMEIDFSVFETGHLPEYRPIVRASCGLGRNLHIEVDGCYPCFALTQERRILATCLLKAWGLSCNEIMHTHNIRSIRIWGVPSARSATFAGAFVVFGTAMMTQIPPRAIAPLPKGMLSLPCGVHCSDWRWNRAVGNR